MLIMFNLKKDQRVLRRDEPRRPASERVLGSGILPVMHDRARYAVATVRTAEL